MMKYVIAVLVILLNVYQITASVYGFDFSVCNYYNASVGGPMPQWALGYSTNVEWKIVGRNTTVGVQEYVDPVNQVRSITASIEGTTVQTIINDKNSEYYTIINGQCTTTNLQTAMVYFPDTYGLGWLTMTKDWYQVMSSAAMIKQNSTTIRSMPVDHWTSCLYVVNFDITAQVDIYFGNHWNMPAIDPNILIPVRIELRGKINGTDSKAFHVIGDIFNFNPTPAFDPQNVQPPSGMYCPGKYPGQPIIVLPSSFYGIMEIVDRDSNTITFKEIWFHAGKRLVRYDTKSSDGSDSDPYMTILNFNTGIQYKIDKYIGSCDTGLVVIGDYFVKSTNNSVDIVSVTEFFSLDDAHVQYVGKRWTRGILCDVWIGYYFDDSVSKNFTAEWYFASDGWREAVGLSLQTGPLIKMDIFAGTQYPLSYNIHRMDPTEPPLSVFDLNSCFQPSQKAHFIILFKVSGGDLIAQISKSYLQDILHKKLTETIQIESTRLTNIFMEYFGGSEFYLIGTLLEKTLQTNPNLLTPSFNQIPLDAAYAFLEGQIEGGWTQNVTTSTGQSVTFVGVNIVRLSYQAELTTTTMGTTPTLPFIVPTLPNTNSSNPGQPTPPTIPSTIFQTPGVPTVKPVVSSTTQKTTIKLATTTSPKMATTTSPKMTTTTSPKMATTAISNKVNSINRSTNNPCVCPKMTCPTITTSAPPPAVTCPNIKLPTPMTQKQISPMTITTTTLKTSAVTSSKQSCSPSATTLSGLNKGATAGICVFMLLIGLAIGIIGTIFYHKRQRPFYPRLVSNIEENEKY